MRWIKWILASILGTATGIGIYKATKTKQENARKTGKHVPYGPYEAFFKRPIDAVLSAAALIVLSPVFLIIAILVRVKLGSPVIFKQERPGKDEKIFTLYKFRTMTDEKDKNGNLLPDEERLTSFGISLRASSGDELGELINIVKGDMAIVGPRPQLVRDMVFMSEEQRRRHVVRPGLTGAAQINGRNALSWEQKFAWDLKYIEKISFISDLKILILTVQKVFFRTKNVKTSEIEITQDYGDVLLRANKVSKPEYDAQQAYARSLLKSMENEPCK